MTKEISSTGIATFNEEAYGKLSRREQLEALIQINSFAIRKLEDLFPIT